MRLVKLTVLSVMKIHARAAIFAALVYGCDRAATLPLLPVSFALAHVVGGAVGSAIAVIGFLVAPDFLMGETLVDFRRQMLAKAQVVKAKFLPPRSA